jgi:hypothetical protein
MGAGTDIAIESADVVIVGNRLGAIVTAREISRWSYRKTKQNVGLAFLFNGLGIPVLVRNLIRGIAWERESSGDGLPDEETAVRVEATVIETPATGGGRRSLHPRGLRPRCR